MKRFTPLLVLALGGLSSRAHAEPLQIEIERIESFAITGEGELAGPLEFLGGLVLSSEDEAFGGLSGIDIPDGETVFMVGDSGTFVRAKLLVEDGRLVGLAEAEIDNLFPDGETSKALGDAEDIAFDPADPQRGVLVRERQANAMLSFEMQDGRPASLRRGWSARRIAPCDRIPGLRASPSRLQHRRLPAKSSPSLSGHPVDKRTFPAGSPEWASFDVVRRDDFDVSGARFLPNGDLILLERRYVPAWDIAVRMRRVPAASITVGARLDGDIIARREREQPDRQHGRACGARG